MVRRTRQWGVAVALVALVAGLMGGCSSSDKDGKADKAVSGADKASGTTVSSTTEPPAPTLAPVAGTGGVTVTPNPIPVGKNDTSATVKVSWQGQKPRTLMFVRVCRRSVTDPTFDSGTDCSLLSEQTPNGTPDGANTIDMPVFRGENPDGDSRWGCFAESDTPPPGVQKNTTCYIRVTNNLIVNNDDDRDAPFTFKVN